MIRCNECGSHQYDGTLFCSECGNSLLEKFVHKTDILPFIEIPRRSPPPPVKGHLLEPAYDHPKLLQFIVPSSRRRFTLELVDELRVGRADPRSEVQPELDLTPDRAAEKGVSRLHAVFQSSNLGIVLIDLNSTNGTLLNNYKLPPDVPYPVISGDEIRFGDLLLHVFWESGGE